MAAATRKKVPVADKAKASQERIGLRVLSPSGPVPEKVHKAPMKAKNQITKARFTWVTSATRK
jgi:hypothetical protein